MRRALQNQRFEFERAITLGLPKRLHLNIIFDRANVIACEFMRSSACRVEMNELCRRRIASFCRVECLRIKRNRFGVGVHTRGEIACVRCVDERFSSSPALR